jgi:mycoredoxin
VDEMITIFGTDWCGDCIRVRSFFDKCNIDYIWIDIETDTSAEEFVLSVNHGMRSVPTICFKDGSILVEPTDLELKKIFRIVPA